MWRLISIGSVAGAIAIIIILTGYHFTGTSTFCGSCHSMANNYHAWRLSRHKQFACTECHLPSGNTAHMMLYKAYAGIRDIVGETARSYPYTIKLTHSARDIANSNCSRCHFSTIERTNMVREKTDCMKCHKFLVQRSREQHGIS